MEDKSAVAPEVNRLYWNTDQSVSEISNRLGVSRRALYDAIEPAPAGIDCTECGAELYYQNRSAKAAGLARCLMCGGAQTPDDTASHEDIGTIPPYDQGWPAPERHREERDRAGTIVGFAIAGVVVGAIATILVRRNR